MHRVTLVNWSGLDFLMGKSYAKKSTLVVGGANRGRISKTGQGMPPILE
jgi:hypothetical protein